MLTATFDEFLDASPNNRLEIAGHDTIMQDFQTFLQTKTEKKTSIDMYTVLMNKSLTVNDLADCSVSLEDLLTTQPHTHTWLLVQNIANFIAYSTFEHLTQEQKKDYTNKILKHKNLTLWELEIWLHSLLPTTIGWQSIDKYLQQKIPFSILVGYHNENFTNDAPLTSLSWATKEAANTFLEIYAGTSIAWTLKHMSQVAQEVWQTMKTPTWNTIVRSVSTDSTKKSEFEAIINALTSNGWVMSTLPPLQRHQLLEFMKSTYLSSNEEGNMLKEAYWLSDEQVWKIIDGIFSEGTTAIRLTTPRWEDLSLKITSQLQDIGVISSINELLQSGTIPLMVHIDMDNQTLMQQRWKSIPVGQSESFFTIPTLPNHIFHPDQLHDITDTATWVTYTDIALDPIAWSSPQQWDCIQWRRNFGWVPHWPLPNIDQTRLDSWAITITPKEKWWYVSWEDAMKIPHLLWAIYAAASMSPEKRQEMLREKETENIEALRDSMNLPADGEQEWENPENQEGNEQINTVEETKNINAYLRTIKGDAFPPESECQNILATKPTFYMWVGPSMLAWWWKRFRTIRVDSINAKTISLSVLSPEFWSEPKTIPIPYTLEALKNILTGNKKFAVSDLYTFKDHASVTDWGMHLKSKLEPWKFDGWMKNFLQYAQSDLFFNSIKNSSGKKIQYFWKEMSDIVKDGEGKASLLKRPLMYKIERNGKNVEVSDPKQWFKQSMTYNEFMLFIAEKNLRGYTQEQYDEINPKDTPSNDGDSWHGGQWWVQRFSIGNILSGFSWLIDVAKNKLKENDEKRGKAFLRKLKLWWFVKLLWKLPIIGDAYENMAQETLSEIDSEKWQKIEEHKEWCKTRWWLWWGKPAWYIKWLLENADAVRMKDPLILAGALLYTMETGWSLYFRSLGDIKHPKIEHSKPPYGLWVYRILWPESYQQWLKYHKALLAKAQAEPNNLDIADELATSELRFIFKTFDNGNQWRDKHGLTKRESMYGMKFRGYLQGQITQGLFSTNKIENAKNEMNEDSFENVYNNELNPSIINIRTERILAVQEVLGNKVGDDEEKYNKRTFAMLMPMMAWIQQHHYNSTYKSKYKDIARRFGFPFAHYAGDMESRRKLSRLFDALTPEWSPLFSEVVKVGDITTWASNYKEMYTAMETWWHEHGTQLMANLQNPTKLYQKKASLLEQGAAGNQKALDMANEIENYLVKGVMSDDLDGVSGSISPDSIIYQKHLFSLPPGVTQQILSQFTPNWQYRGATPQATQLLRKILWEKMQWVNSAEKTSKEDCGFYTKKFFQWFGSYLNTEQKKILLAGLHKHDAQEPWAREAIMWAVRAAFARGSAGASLPTEIGTTLETFEDFFMKNGKFFTDTANIETIKESMIRPDLSIQQMNTIIAEKDTIIENAKNRNKYYTTSYIDE
jgi:hypothetical protein